MNLNKVKKSSQPCSESLVYDIYVWYRSRHNLRGAICSPACVPQIRLSFLPRLQNRQKVARFVLSEVRAIRCSYFGNMTTNEYKQSEKNSQPCTEGLVYDIYFWYRSPAYFCGRD